MKSRKLCFAFAVLAFVLPAKVASAQASSDLGSWCHIQLIKSFGKPYAMARLEHRSYERIGATECYFAMAGGGYKFKNWLQGDLSYEFWKLPAYGNATTHKAVACVAATLRREALAVSLREKYELAFPGGGGNPSSTLRTRVRVQYTPSSSIFTPYAIYEFFNGFEGQAWQRSLHYLGTDIKLGKHNALDVYYMFHLFPGAGSVAACHILGIGYVLTL